MRNKHIHDKVKIVYDDVEIIFKGKGAFNKLAAYRDDLHLNDFYDYKCYWKVGLLFPHWERMYTTNMLSRYDKTVRGTSRNS